MKIVLLCLTMMFSAQAAQRHKIDTLGASAKGQFVALEEYGYQPASKAYYVSIRILNVWSKEYVGSPVQVEVPASKDYIMNDARLKARQLAQENLKAYKIILN